MSGPSAPPLFLHSVAFAFRGAADAIVLLDDDNMPVGRDPEWTEGGRREVAAYVREALPSVRVVFRRNAAVAAPRYGTVTVRAACPDGPGVAPQTFGLRFQADGLTEPIEFRLASKLPDRVGCVDVAWTWQIEGARRPEVIGTSEHRLCLVWKEILDPSGWLGARAAARISGGLEVPWTYAKVIEWTCAWAAGLDDEKAIVDSIFANLPKSLLQYAVDADDVAEMLRVGGAYCGVWSRMFQAMAASQGVAVESHGFQVDWRDLHGMALWCAIVITSPGINRTEPAWDASVHYDAICADPRWPLRTHSAVRRRMERRYLFWGAKGGRADGHAVNILKHDGRYYLYDPSFMRGPITLDWRRLPPAGARVDVRALGNFREAYLEDAVHYMLGVLPWGASHREGPGLPAGATVSDLPWRSLTFPTAMLPSARGTLTFYWL